MGKEKKVGYKKFASMVDRAWLVVFATGNPDGLTREDVEKAIRNALDQTTQSHAEERAGRWEKIGR